jgi:RNA ligase-like protein
MVRLESPKNSNYAAVVVKINNVVDLENCDNVQATNLLGFQAIVGKDVKVGDIGIVFPVEVQLSDSFCRENNLYRDNANNNDKSLRGYIEPNRRVRAQKFRGNRSDCLFLSLSSLDYTGINTADLTEGQVFDTINGQNICKKYVVKQAASSKPARYQEKKYSRVDNKVFPQHIDTANFFRMEGTLPENSYAYVTAKLHGTSIRCGHIPVSRKLTWLERLARRFGVKVNEQEYDYIYGSRRVVKDGNNPDSQSYYDTDIYSIEGAKLKGLLPKNYMVFGELIGWTPTGSPIQTNYTYGVPKGHAQLWVYRVANINEDGNMTDLSWDQVKEFCVNRNLRHVPELWRGSLKDLEVESFLDTRFLDVEGYKNCPPLDSPKLVDEGICVRIGDGITPMILKAKSSKFLQMETKLLDKGEIDMESHNV